jgi:hypothetical protein
VASKEVDLTVILLLPLVVFRAGVYHASPYTKPKCEVKAPRGGTRSCAASSGSSGHRHRGTGRGAPVSRACRGALSLASSVASSTVPPGSRCHCPHHPQRVVGLRRGRGHHLGGFRGGRPHSRPPPPTRRLQGQRTRRRTPPSTPPLHHAEAQGGGPSWRDEKLRSTEWRIGPPTSSNREGHTHLWGVLGRTLPSIIHCIINSAHRLEMALPPLPLARRWLAKRMRSLSRWLPRRSTSQSSSSSHL